MLSPVAQSSERDERAALPLEEWFELPGWHMEPPLLTPLSAEQLGPCLVFGTGELPGALVARLRALGCAALQVSAGPAFAADPQQLTVDPSAAGDYERLLGWLADRSQRPRRIILAWTLGAQMRAGGSTSSLERALLPAIAAAQAAARGADRSALEIEILTAGAYRVEGIEPVDPALTTVLGPTRVIPLELPHIAVRHIDLGAGELERDLRAGSIERLAEGLIAELAASPPPPIVALRGNRRWLPHLRPIQLYGHASAPAWRRHGSYLITGGLGGMGLALAEHLARQAGARLALVARTPLPPRERWDSLPSGHPAHASIAAIAAIEKAGGTVATYSADVTDAAAMRAVRDDVLQRFGRLDGIVHSAGVAGGGLIEALDRDGLEGVLAPKVAGTLALADVFGDLPLDFFLLCSSLASFVGGVGQVAYCAANAFLDSFPHSGYPLAERARVVNWGGLLGGGMWMPSDGDVGMALEDAMEALRRAVQAQVRPRVVIAPVHVRDALPWMPSTASRNGAPATSADAATSVADLEPRLREIWSEALELDEEVPPDGDFFALGGNSMLAIELLWRLADELGCRLPMQRLIEAPTPTAAARAIAAQLADEIGDGS